MSTDELRNEWYALWQRLGAAGDAGLIYEDLALRYSEPGRFYHTLVHIDHCLHELKEYSGMRGDLDAIAFALWFHDAIYDARCKDSEERSATLATETATSAGLADSFGDLTRVLILATKHHAPPLTLNEQILVDIDLSILGQNQSRFDEYEEQIRQEYSWASDEAFAMGRAAILSSFLTGPRIYSTDYFHEKYESLARANLARSIARLTGTMRVP